MTRSAAPHRPLYPPPSEPADFPATAGSADPGPVQPPAGHRAAVLWGLVVGIGTAATPAAFWWLPAATVYAVGIVFIAAVYLGFAVADGRRHVIAVETGVVAVFVVIAALAVTSTLWLVVACLVAHGIKDFWQHRTHFVAGTRWWPPFCAAVDWGAAVLISVALIAGVPIP